MTSEGRRSFASPPRPSCFEPLSVILSNAKDLLTKSFVSKAMTSGLFAQMAVEVSLLVKKDSAFFFLLTQKKLRLCFLIKK